ncbi:MAG: TonB-dependent receptor [Erythrobacter sp.]|nr:TonB-dependent receptor [Erythrobacter sp.]
MGSKRFSANARLLSGAAMGLAMVAGAVPAMAQETDEAEGEGNQIIVTGIRASIETSLEAKRDATSIVEVISSEDIGQLPDLSIADALARLPGVTAQRVRGRSQQISIRGLGPDFSLSLLNGREVVSAGNNRGIEFDQFPSELINQAVVYKTGDAQLAAIGIAGAVDLRTVRPLDFNDRQINVSARYVVNDSGSLNPDFSDDGYRFFASLIDQNADGTVGWSLGATVQSNPTHFISRELKTSDTRDINDRTVLTGQVRRDANGVFYAADNPRQGVVSRDFQRVSIAGALQFEPYDNFNATIDAFYTDTEDSGIFRGTETPIASWSGASFDGTTGAGPFAETATYSAVVPILRTDTEGSEAQIFAIGANIEWGITSNLNFVFDYGYSTLDRNDIDYESYAGTGPGRSGAQDVITFNTPISGRYSLDTQLDYTDPANALLTDPGGWGQVGFIKEPEIEDELNQLRAELDYEFDGGFLGSITVGYLYTDRHKNFDSNESFLRPSAAFVDGALAVPTNAIVGVTDTGGLNNNILAYDPSSFLTDGTYLVEKATFDTEWIVDEEVHNFYVQANIDADLGGVPLRGNIGLRYADTRQSSTGTIGGGLLNTVSEQYDDFLPSANLSFEVAEDLYIRLAAAKSITRARLDQLAANQNINFNPLACVDSDGDQVPDTVIGFNPPQLVCFNLSGGNPALQPYESVSYDLSVEKYFSPGTAVIVAVFHKDLSDWVVDFNEIIDLEQSIVNAGFGSILTGAPELATGAFSGPINFADGSITGVEGTVRVDFADVTSALDGFGAFFSITYADAELQDEGQGFTPIPGYSETTWSADVFYEKDGIQAKLAARYRDGFRSEVQQFDGGLTGADSLSETILDAQIGYTFQNESGPLEGLALQFEVFNITNEPFTTENGLLDVAGIDEVGRQPSRHELYGRTFNFTIRKNF